MCITVMGCLAKVTRLKGVYIFEDIRTSVIDDPDDGGSHHATVVPVNIHCGAYRALSQIIVLRASYE